MVIEIRGVGKVCVLIRREDGRGNKVQREDYPNTARLLSASQGERPLNNQT